MTVVFQLNATSVTGAPAQLKIAVPGGYSCLADVYGVMGYNDTGNWALGNIFTLNGPYIYLQPGILGVTSWTNGVNTVYTRGSITFEVQ